MVIGKLELFQKYGLNPQWRDVFVGLRLGLLTSLDVAELRATGRIGKIPGSSEDVIVTRAIAEVDTDPDEENEELSLRRWRYVLMQEAIKKHADQEQLLVDIERLWADFEYPDDMRHLIYYMPPADGYNPKLHSAEENRGRLVQLAVVFLERESQAVK